MDFKKYWFYYLMYTILAAFTGWLFNGVVGAIGGIIMLYIMLVLGMLIHHWYKLFVEKVANRFKQ